MGISGEERVLGLAIYDGIDSGRQNELKSRSGIIKVSAPVVDLDASHNSIVGRSTVHCLGYQCLQIRCDCTFCDLFRWSKTQSKMSMQGIDRYQMEIHKAQTLHGCAVTILHSTRHRFCMTV